MSEAPTKDTMLGLEIMSKVMDVIPKNATLEQTVNSLMYLCLSLMFSMNVPTNEIEAQYFNMVKYVENKKKQIEDGMKTAH